MTNKNPKTNPSDKTASDRAGPDLSLARTVWTKTAITQCRVELVRKLLSENLGFNEVEDYCTSLELKLQSEKLKTSRENGNCDKTIVREIMGRKLIDASNCHREALAELYGVQQREGLRGLQETKRDL